MLFFHYIKVICKDEDNHLCLVTYEEAKDRHLQIIANLRSSFEINKSIKLKDGTQGHLYKCYNRTLPLFKKVTCDKDTLEPNYNFTKIEKETDLFF